MPHSIEEQGIQVLTGFLKSKGSQVERIGGTFDIKVDGKNAEVKTSRQKFDQLGFVGFSKNQFDAVQRKEEFNIYFVCNLSADSPEILKMTSKDLLELNPTIITHYEYPRSSLKQKAEVLSS